MRSILVENDLDAMIRVTEQAENKEKGDQRPRAPYQSKKRGVCFSRVGHERPVCSGMSL